MANLLLTRLLNRLANNAGLVGRVIDTYQQQLPGLLAQLSAAVAAGDAKEAGDLAHRIKGSAAYFENDSVTRSANRLEAGELAAHPDLLAALGALETELGEAKSQLVSG